MGKTLFATSVGSVGVKVSGIQASPYQEPILQSCSMCVHDERISLSVTAFPGQQPMVEASSASVEQVGGGSGEG